MDVFGFGFDGRAPRDVDWLIDDHEDIVRRSKNAALVGASGIVVQETENTFKVVTRKNKSKGAFACGPTVLPCRPYISISIFIHSSHLDSFLQYYQSRGPSSHSPSLCIAQNLPLLATLGRI